MLRFTVRAFVLIALLAILAGPASAQDDPVTVLFMHHSTGLGVIEGGDVRAGFTDLGYAFWDHGYNDEGLVDPAGEWLGINWDVPGDNTDPDGWFAIFQQPVTDPPSNTFSHMLQHDVILFKSCFPTSNIYDDAMLQTYKGYYLTIRDVIDQHPDKLFIPFTPPPLVPNETEPANAARAQQWADFLTSDEFTAGHPNMMVFDFFHLLADEDGFLRAEYRGDEWDSHPNDIANAEIGPVLVEFVDQAVREFMPDRAPTAPLAQPDTPQDESGDSDQAGDEGDTASESGDDWDHVDVFAGFEPATALDYWWDYTNDPVREFACTLDQPGYADSAHALRLAYDIPAEGGGGCGANVVSGDEWANAAGISFVWRADQPDLVMRFAAAVSDPAAPDDDATPFEIELTTAGPEWTEVTIRWDDLQKADWFDGGADVFDPANVTFIVFDVGNWERPQQGSIWIDDLRLLTE